MAVALGACSATPPASGEPPRAAQDVRPAPAAAPAAPAAAPTPPPDAREVILSAAIVELIEHEHLLQKKVDDELSRTAFATYLDHLDPGKAFLLRRDREALAKYSDKIDDELKSGSLELAHEAERIYQARITVVEKMVAELLAHPFNHDDEEWIELDPKKLEVAATDDELRDRWRRRLELDVLERTAQMEARLKAISEHKAKDGKADQAKKPGKDDKTTAKAGKPDKTKPSVPSTSVTPHTSEDVDTKTDDSAVHEADLDDEDAATPLAKIPATAEGRDAKARADLAKSYAARFARAHHPGPLDAASGLINAVTASLDPHTQYLPPADKANFDIRMSGSLEGIGALLREHDDYVEIVEIVPGGASWRQGGLSPGDLILSVAADGQDPVDVADMRLDDVVKMIRGPKGTVVHLKIQRPSGEQTTVSITRDVIVVEETYARGAVINHAGGPSYGYIHLPSFYGGRDPGQRTASGDVRHLLGEMKSRKVAGVIIDIRSNGGGLLGEAIQMTGELIDHGPVVQVKDSRHPNPEVLNDEHRGTDYDGPVIVLVDRFSASASEILAGALQDYQRAIIVGTAATHGKGTVQTLADLDRATGGKVDLGVLKLTIQQFFRVSGASTQLKGVTPDVLLPDPAGYIESGERTLEHAIPWTQVAPADHDMWHTTWKPQVLVQRSAARVAKQPVLAKMASLVEVLRASRNDTRIPLQRTAWEAHRKQQRDALEAASPDLKAQPPSLTVKSLDDPALPPPGPGGKAEDPLTTWRNNLSRDPWVDECVNILGDMVK